MAPKSFASKEKDVGVEEEVLQAVIIADSFNKRFRPLTSGKPRCLLPVCNAPLLDWTFESLALAGVQEIFVICRSHANQVKAAIRDSKWSQPSSGLKVVPIVTSREIRSTGEAMRDVYTHGVINSDFVLVQGDLVSNVRIDEVVREHKERRKKNKDAIMTMVVKESGARHRTRSKGESSVFVLDAQTNECLHYEPVDGYPPKKYAQIPREIFDEHPEVEVRNDLIDCGIDVCSVDVPSLFQDNFDYLDIRRDFLYGVLTSDLLTEKIYCYVATDGYAARVKDTRSYDAVSKDILARWAFPLVPDDNHPCGHLYEHLRGNKYIACDDTVVLSRTCKIGTNTLIGSSTQVFDNAEVSSSVIGQRCHIGPDAVIKNSYIFDEAFIGANCVITNAIIGRSAHIGDGSTIERGCLVGDGTVLGKGAKLRPFERVSKREKDQVWKLGEDDDNEESEEDSELEDFEPDAENDAEILGEGSNALVWPRGPRTDHDDDSDNEAEIATFTNQRLMRIGDTVSDLDLSDAGSVTEDEESSESDSEDSDPNRLSRTSSRTSLASLDAPEAAAAQAEFLSEVKLSLERAFAEGHTVDNAAVELKTLRMASNVDISRVREAVIQHILEDIELCEDMGKQRAAIAKVIDRWGELINKIGGVDPVETVTLLQTSCAASPTRNGLFGQLLASMYQADIVDEPDIKRWHKLPLSKGVGMDAGDKLDRWKKCWLVGGKLIEQFDDQESSDEDEDEASAPPTAAPKAKTKEDSEDDEEEEEAEEEDDDDDEPKAASKPSDVKSEESSEEEEAEAEEEDDDEPKAASKPSEVKSKESSDEEEVEVEEEPEVGAKPAMVKEEEASEDDEDEEAPTPPSTTPKVEQAHGPISEKLAEAPEESDSSEAEEALHEPTNDVPPTAVDSSEEEAQVPTAAKQDTEESSSESEAEDDEELHPTTLAPSTQQSTEDEADDEESASQKSDSRATSDEESEEEEESDSEAEHDTSASAQAKGKQTLQVATGMPTRDRRRTITPADVKTPVATGAPEGSSVPKVASGPLATKTAADGESSEEASEDSQAEETDSSEAESDEKEGSEENSSEEVGSEVSSEELESEDDDETMPPTRR